eukprot:3033774-Rhodomonas_salina.2
MQPTRITLPGSSPTLRVTLAVVPAPAQRFCDIQKQHRRSIGPHADSDRVPTCWQIIAERELPGVLARYRERGLRASALAKVRSAISGS